jgi:hypothetical protein
MVKLMVDDFDQISILENMLEQNNISFVLELSNWSYGIRPPFLIVNGVPLDMGRAIKWIKEHGTV